MKKVRFIVNPFSGTSDKLDFEKQVKTHLDLTRFEPDIRMTEAPLHAKALAKEAVDNNYDIVVAAGGDGTVNEVASMVVHSNTCLGIIPGGSGNGLAMHLGLGRNMAKAIKIINTAETRSIDTCKVNDIFFINVSGLGFDARVTHMIKNSVKRGFQAYFKTTLAQLIKYKPIEAKIEIPGTDTIYEGKYALIAASNGSMYGYNFSICPPAKIDDGKMDVLLLRDASLIKYLLSSYKILNKTIHKSSFVDYFKCEEMKITLKGEDYLHVDGESTATENEHHYKIYPNSIKLLLPPNAKI